MLPSFTLSLTATPDPADVQAVQDGLFAYNPQPRA